MVADDNILREYLLGALSEKENEQIDELSIADTAVSARLNAVENDLIDGYTAGELSGLELQQFEQHYLASPIRRQRVVFASAFQEFGERGKTPQMAKETKPFIFAGLSPIFRWGFAVATLLLVVAAGWFWLGRTKPQEVAVSTPPADQTGSPMPTPVQITQTGNDETVAVAEKADPQNVNVPQSNRKNDGQQNAEIKPNNPVSPTIATFVLSPPTRGQIRSITIPSGTERATFTFELESTDFPKYSLTLRQQGSDRFVWQGGSLNGNKRAALSINIPAKLLSQGIYTFSVAGIPRAGSDEIIGDYTFRVVQ
ncbi:MAG: hypothetical protein ABL959_00360 [Pyrinomonadaceae bacterium]